MENHNLSLANQHKSTISTAIFNSNLLDYQRVRLNDTEFLQGFRAQQPSPGAEARYPRHSALQVARAAERCDPRGGVLLGGELNGWFRKENPVKVDGF